MPDQRADIKDFKLVTHGIREGVQSDTQGHSEGTYE